MKNVVTLKEIFQRGAKKSLRLTLGLLLATTLLACATLDQGSNNQDMQTTESNGHAIDHATAINSTPSPINHQFDLQHQEIDNIRKEIASINNKRYKIKQEIFEIRLKEGLSGRDIKILHGELDRIDQQYININSRLAKLSTETNSNSNAITKLERQEAYRKEVIIQLNENWQKINRESDKKLLKIENGGADAQRLNE